MLKSSIQISTPGGITSQAALQISNIARQHGAMVQFTRQDGLSVYVNSPGLLQMMRLKCGDEVLVAVEGGDEQRVMDELSVLLTA